MFPTGSGFYKIKVSPQNNGTDNIYAYVDTSGTVPTLSTIAGTDPKFASLPNTEVYFYYDSPSQKLSTVLNLSNPPPPSGNTWLTVSTDYVLGNTLTFTSNFDGASQLNTSDSKFRLSIQGMNGMLGLSQIQFSYTVVVATQNYIPLYFWFLQLITPQTYIDLYNNILTPIDPMDPTYLACNPYANPSTFCYYNHSKTTPNVPVLVEISSDPNAYVGINIPQAVQNVSQLSMTPNDNSVWFATQETQFLGPPYDLLQTTNIQPSASFDSSCTSNNPATCAQNPDKYCRDSNGNVTGLSCAPGTIPYLIDQCTYQPNQGYFLGHYQCYAPQIWGITDKNGKKVCVDGGNPSSQPPGTQLFTTMQACYENWADCPPGYKRNLGSTGRPGCYLDGSNMNTSWGNPCGTHCSAPDGACGYNGTDNFWVSHCHGNCAGQCYCDCYNSAPVPPYGYYCVPGSTGSDNSYWMQNKTNQPINPCSDANCSNLWFGLNRNYFCGSSSNYGN